VVMFGGDTQAGPLGGISPRQALPDQLLFECGVPMAEATAVAATFAYRHEAEFARETLRAAGIDSILIADDAGGALAGLSFTTPIRLVVHIDDLAQARAVLHKDADGRLSH